MSTSYFFFDLGNTLVKSYDLKKAFSETNYGNLKSDELLNFASIFEKVLICQSNKDKAIDGWRNLFNISLEKANIIIDEDELDNFASIMLKNYLEKCVLEPYATDVLNILNLNQKVISLISNMTGPPNVFSKYLENINISKYFKSITWSCAVGYRKPDSEIFKIGLYESNAKINESVFIGDSEECDIAGANKIGMKTILLVESDSINVSSKANWIVEKSRIYHFIKEYLKCEF